MLREAVLVLPRLEEELRARHANLSAVFTHDVVFFLEAGDDPTDETLADPGGLGDLPLGHGLCRVHEQPAGNPRALGREGA